MTNFYQVKEFCPSGSFPYAIKAGDTLYNLAQEFNTSVEAIMELNPRLNPYNLQTGQIICIPAETPAKCPANSFEYTIKSGDTLYNLAKRYDTSVEEILAINPNLNPYNLQVGQKICIPSKAPAKCPANSFEYTIKAGDTLYNLANQYNTSVEEILAINPS
ncbi:MAG TPA: LysM peptidoglycan-binding domain-containing protein, partial [Tissierellaceae bacterium]|nr:LysM peptidoglycan-binding domain-containing protein [Tissierellaceae bacterium]